MSQLIGHAVTFLWSMCVKGKVLQPHTQVQQDVKYLEVKPASYRTGQHVTELLYASLLRFCLEQQVNRPNVVFSICSLTQKQVIDSTRVWEVFQPGCYHLTFSYVDKSFPLNTDKHCVSTSFYQLKGWIRFLPSWASGFIWSKTLRSHNRGV